MKSIHNCDNIEGMKSIDFTMDMLEPDEDDTLEKDDLLMLDCFDPDEFEEFLADSPKNEFDALPVVDNDVPSPMNVEQTEESRGKFSRRNSIPKRSVSPPAKRQHRMAIDQTHTQAAFPSPQTQTPPAPAGSDIHPQYNEMIEKLALSMQRSEQSRARIIQHCHKPAAFRSSSGVSSSSRQLPSAQTSTVGGLAGFLSGRSSSLTAGLEQSRKQVRAYMGHMSLSTL